jgi:plastocyanin
VQDGPGVVAITLILDADTSVRDTRLADLARTASGSAIPVITAAPTTAATAAPSGAQAGGPGQQVQGQTAAVKVQETDQLKFNPGSQTLKAGQVVEWDNGSSVAHNVTFDDYSSITSDTMNSGDTYQVKFTKPGTYQYHCTFHPGMNGTVTVQ